MSKIIKNWKLHSLLTISFLLLYLSVLVNTTLIIASANDDKLNLEIHGISGSVGFIAKETINLMAWYEEDVEDLKFEFSIVKVENGKDGLYTVIKNIDCCTAEWIPQDAGIYNLNVSAIDKNGQIICQKCQDIIVVNQYIGIKNPGNACSLCSALQLLHNNEKFRNAILNLREPDANARPYLHALYQQFYNIKNNVRDGAGIKMAFSGPQIESLIFDENGNNFSLDKGWAETRLLETCYSECENIAEYAELKNIIDSMKKSFIICHEVKKSYPTNISLKDCISKNPSNETLNICMDSTVGFDYNSHKVLEENNSKFELTGALIHNGGHFFAIVKDSFSEEWYKLDDISVSKISIEDVQKYIFSDSHSKVRALQLTYSKIQ